MMRLIPMLLGAAVVAVSAVDAGRLSGRWGASDELKATIERVGEVKEVIGDWKSESRDLDARQLQVAGVEGYVSRQYTNRKTGARVQVLLVCGRPGPICVHEPDVCYTSAGYLRVGELEKIKVGDDSEFKVGKFARRSPHADALRIMWSWTTGSHWQAPDNPRRAFGRDTKALCKLYVIRQIGPGDDTEKADPSSDFLRVMLPELKRCLAPTS
jgi:hypothetical protein